MNVHTHHHGQIEARNTIFRRSLLATSRTFQISELVLNLLTPKKVVVYAFAVLKRAGVRHLLITKRGVVETEISMHIVVLDQSILF